MAVGVCSFHPNETKTAVLVLVLFRYLPYQDGMGRRRAIQTELELRSHGGRRVGAGRKPTGSKAGVPHRVRPSVSSAHPQHVTVRLHRDLPNLRVRRTAKTIRAALQAGADRHGLRVQHWSIQRDHVHLIVEAHGRTALSRGMQGLKIRLAKALNRVWNRTGGVFSDRYHAHALKTPREVRNALLYVLNNFRKHHPRRRYPKGWMDPLSTAAEFDGWSKARGAEVPARPARSWLLRVGWRRGGLLDPDRVPSR